MAAGPRLRLAQEYTFTQLVGTDYNVMYRSSCSLHTHLRCDGHSQAIACAQDDLSTQPACRSVVKEDEGIEPAMAAMLARWAGAGEA